jgi:alanyl-tRNA synthetase
VAVVAGAADGQATVVVAASRDLAGEGFDAAAVVRQVAPLIKGGGGGRPEMAQAGGSDPDGLDAAVGEATRLALESLRALEAG